jgi:hypothetical protein
MQELVTKDCLMCGGAIEKRGKTGRRTCFCRCPCPKPRKSTGKKRKSTPKRKKSSSRKKKKTTPKKKTSNKKRKTTPKKTPKKTSSKTKKSTPKKVRKSIPKKETPKKRKDTVKSKSSVEPEPVIVTTLPPEVVDRPAHTEVVRTVASVVGIPSGTERTVVVGDIPVVVRFRGSTPRSIVYDVSIQASPETREFGTQTEIETVIDIPTSTVSTSDASVQVSGLADVDGTLVIETTPELVEQSTQTTTNLQVEKRKNGGKKKYKATIAALIAALLALSGRDATDCVVVQSDPILAQIQPSPLPHHFLLSNFGRLGVDPLTPLQFGNITLLSENLPVGPLNSDDMRSLTTIEKEFKTRLDAAVAEGIQNSHDAYRFGETVASTRANEIIDELRSKLSGLTKELKEISRFGRELKSENDDLMEALRKAGTEMLRLQKVTEEQGLDNEQKAALISNLGDVAREVRNIVGDINANDSDILKMLRDLIADKRSLQAKLIEFEKELDGDTVSQLREKISELESAQTELKKSLEAQIQFHNSEVKRLYEEHLVTERNTETAAIKNEKRRLIGLHQEEVKKLKKAHREAVKQAKEETATEISTAMNKQVETLKQQLDYAVGNLDSFMDWHSPKIQVLDTKNGKYKVVYDVENVRRTSPLVAEYVKNLATELEKTLNGQWFGAPAPKPYIDLSVQQDVVFKKNFLSNMKEFIFGKSQSGGTRFQMVKVGSSKAIHEGRTYQAYNYMPVVVDDLPIAQELKDEINELADKIAIMSITTVTTTISEPPKTETVTSAATPQPSTRTTTVPITMWSTVPTTITSTETSTLPQATTTVTFTITETPKLYSTPVPTSTMERLRETTTTETVKETIKETETETTTVERTATETRTTTTTQMGTTTVISTVTNTETDTVRSTVYVTPTPAPMSVSTITIGTTLFSTSTVTITLTPSDPADPTVTISTPVAVKSEDVQAHVKGEELVEIAAGDSSDGKATQITQKETTRLGCNKPGHWGQYIQSKLYCLDDYIIRCWDLKSRRINRLAPPEDANEFEKRYVQGTLDAPFDPYDMADIFGRAPRIGVNNYFKDNSIEIPLMELIDKRNSGLTRKNFLRAMEIKDIKKTKNDVGWLNYVPSVVKSVVSAWQITQHMNVVPESFTGNDVIQDSHVEVPVHDRNTFQPGFFTDTMKGSVVSGEDQLHSEHGEPQLESVREGGYTNRRRMT